jgi:hypothetical protein
MEPYRARIKENLVVVSDDITRMGGSVVTEEAFNDEWGPYGRKGQEGFYYPEDCLFVTDPDESGLHDEFGIPEEYIERVDDND